MLEGIVKNFPRFSNAACRRSDKNSLLMIDLILSIELERH